MRLLIIGCPKAGKTTLSHHLSSTRPVLATDDLKGAWDDRIKQTLLWLEGKWDVTIEGVIVPHAIRLFLVHNCIKPADKIICMFQPYTPLTPGQYTMKKGIETVWNSIVGEVRRRGTVIDYR